MASKIQPPAATVLSWLRLNLPEGALGALTGTDVKALQAAVSIAYLWSFSDAPHLGLAFGAVVGAMQPSTRRFAYHAIAHAADWSHRSILWAAAGLEPIENPGRCKYE